jgi:hypothetical protein
MTVGDGANVNYNKFNFPKPSKETLLVTLGVALALSVAVNIWCTYTIRDIGTRKWLHDYDLNQFQMHEFAELKGKVEVDHELIKVFGPQQCKR